MNHSLSSGSVTNPDVLIFIRHRPNLIYAITWPFNYGDKYRKVGKFTYLIQAEHQISGKSIISDTSTTKIFATIFRENLPKSLCSVISAKESVLSRRTGVNWSLLYCAKAEPAFSLSKLSFFNKTRTSLKTSLNSPEISDY